jgi:hypothetical protein
MHRVVLHASEVKKVKRSVLVNMSYMSGQKSIQQGCTGKKGKWLVALPQTKKFAAKEDLHIVEEGVPIQATDHPFLVQLLSIFQTRVLCSFFNVHVFRQLLILQTAISINM